MNIEEAKDFIRERTPKSREVFWVIPLDNRNLLIGKPIKLSVGSRYNVLVEPREVLRALIRRNAARGMVVHNHPSGVKNPSCQDILLTKQLVEGGRWIEMPILDHVIMAGDGDFSMKEEHLIGDDE